MALSYYLTAEQFVPLGIGSVFKLFKNFKMRLSNLDWSLRTFAVFKQKHVAKPWLDGFIESALTVRRP